eukprot:6913352-Prymnesium_polylepis.1
MSVTAALDQTFEREISASRDHSARTGACAHWIANRAVSNSCTVSRTQAGRRAVLADAHCGSAPTTTVARTSTTLFAWKLRKSFF